MLRGTPRGTGNIGLKEPREPIEGVLVEDELIALAMRACLDLASGCPGEERRGAGGGRHLIGMGVGGARGGSAPRAISASSALTDHPRSAARSREHASPAVVGFGQERLSVALGERTVVEQLDRFVGELEQATVWARSLRLRPSRRASASW